MKKLFLSIILFATFAAIAQPVFAGDKFYACHITSYDFDLETWEGHVIEINANAVATHCDHFGVSDHHPTGVVNAAVAACADFDGKRYDRCIQQNTVGANCGRGSDNPPAVSQLCGE